MRLNENLHYIMLTSIIFLISNIISAQNKDIFFSPDLLKKDADYYFNMIGEHHPDPYAYSSVQTYAKKKKEIYEQLNRPMTREDFLWLMAPMNAYMDSHSPIDISVNNDYIYNWLLTIENKRGRDSLQKVFPVVDVKGNKLYIPYKGKSIEITEIDGIPSGTVLNFIHSLYNWKLPAEKNKYDMKSLFSIYLDLYFNIRSPYVVKSKKNKKIRIIQGTDPGEYSKQSGLTMLNASKSNYEIYPVSSIGIIHIYNLNDFNSGNLSKTLQEFRDSISRYNLQYLFLDLSNNGGGNVRGFELLDIISHDTIYESRSITKKEKEGNKKYDIHEIVRYPYTDASNVKKTLFVLQGINTLSGADYLCRIIKQNNLGILAGENTGEPTRAFSYCFQKEMPNTKIAFWVATQFVDYSAYFKEETLSPDIHWELNYKRSEFTEKDLQEIIDCWKTKK